MAKVRYNSKKPRRVEILVFGEDILTVPKRISDALLRIPGFEKTTQKNAPSPLEHLNEVLEAIDRAENPEEREQLVAALCGAADSVEVAPEPEPDEAAEFDPAANVDELLAYVGDDVERATAVLEAEQAGKARKTLIEPLEALIGGGGE